MKNNQTSIEPTADTSRATAETEDVVLGNESGRTRVDASNHGRAQQVPSTGKGGMSIAQENNNSEESGTGQTDMPFTGTDARAQDALNDKCSVRARCGHESLFILLPGLTARQVFDLRVLVSGMQCDRCIALATKWEGSHA